MKRTKLLPFVMLDEAYALYSKYVAPMKCKQELKFYKNRWSAAYSKVNSDLFKNNNEDEVIDMMDSLEREVHNTFVMFRLRIQEMLPDSMKNSDVIAAIYTYTVIASYAENIHVTVYGRKCKGIDEIIFWATKFLAKLFNDTGCKLTFDPNQNVECQNLCKTIWSELTEWISEE